MIFERMLFSRYKILSDYDDTEQISNKTFNDLRGILSSDVFYAFISWE